LKRREKGLNAEAQSAQRNRYLNGYIKKLSDLCVSALGKERKI